MIKSVLFAAGLAIAFAGAALTSSPADAQTGCQGTCSNAERQCIQGGGDRDACSAARRTCMQTGVFSNPRTGRTFSGICKN